MMFSTKIALGYNALKFILFEKIMHVLNGHSFVHTCVVGD